MVLGLSPAEVPLDLVVVVGEPGVGGRARDAAPAAGPRRRQGGGEGLLGLVPLLGVVTLVTSMMTPLVTSLVTTIVTSAVVIPVPIRAAWSGACKYENIRLLFRWLYNMYVR